MKIIVDCREESLHKLLVQNLANITNITNITCIKEQLVLGDVIFKDDDDNEIVLFERKTYNDLNASLKDGRYNEQSLRLNSYHLSNHRIVYLLEETSKKYIKGTQMTDNLLHSCIFSLAFYKGFTVLQTKSIIHTALMLIDFAKKYQKDPTKPIYDFENKVNNVQSNIDYTETIKKEKKANITPENIDIIMLSQIPDVSTLTAKVILDQYKNVHNLIDGLNENKDCLDEISYLTKNEKKRKLTKKIIENIKKYLCKIQEPVLDMSKII